MDAIILFYAKVDPDTLTPNEYFRLYRAIEFIRVQERKRSI